MNRIVMVIGAVLLIAALVFVNKGISRTSAPDQDDDDDQQQSQQNDSKPAPKPSSTPVKELLPPEITGGDQAKAKYQIKLGWMYDEKTQASPEAAAAAVDTIARFADTHQKDVAVEIVNLDLPPTDVSPSAGTVPGLGLSVTGNGVNLSIPGNAGEPRLTPPQIEKALSTLKF